MEAKQQRTTRTFQPTVRSGVDLYSLEEAELFQSAVIDLILTDVRIPRIDALVELQAKSPQTKLIALLPPAVLLGKDDFRSLLQSLGAQRTLSTPFALEEILEAVRAVVDSDA